MPQESFFPITSKLSFPPPPPAPLIRILYRFAEVIFSCFRICCLEEKQSNESSTTFAFQRKDTNVMLSESWVCVPPGVWVTVLSAKSTKGWQWEYQGSPVHYRWRSRSVPLPRTDRARLWWKSQVSVCFISLLRQTLPEVCSEQDELDFLMEALIIRWGDFYQARHAITQKPGVASQNAIW